MLRSIALASLLVGCTSADRTGAPGEVPSPPTRVLGPAEVRAPVAAAEASVPSRPGFLKGQTHVHTARSHDAKTPPEDVLAFYAERGYDFVALTDHNRITVVDPPEGLLLVPGVELTHNATICRPKPRPGYRCLFHTTALFVDPSKDANNGGKIRFPFAQDRDRAFLIQMDLTKDFGGITVLNHPSFHFAADAKTIVRLAGRGLSLVEVWNAGLDTQHPRGRDAAEDRAEALWDDVLTRGGRVFALATDDAHHFADAAQRARLGKSAYTGDRAWISVRAEKNPEAIREAITAGDFYASTGVELRELALTTERLEVKVETPRTCTIRFSGREGKSLHTAPCPTGRYEPRGDEGYVRASVTTPDGKKAWTQPVFLANPAGSAAPAERQ